VHEAGIQDRDGASCVLASIRSRYPWLRHIFADGGYAGEKLRKALKRIGEWTVEIIKRSDTAQGFEVLPRRRVVLSHGSVAVTDWQRISKRQSPAQLPGCSSLTSASSESDS
jgi:transposase